MQQDQRKHQENDVCDRAVEIEIETSDGRDLPDRIGERRVRDEHRRNTLTNAPEAAARFRSADRRRTPALRNLSKTFCP